MYKSSTEFMNISLNKIASILFVSVGITTYEVNGKFTCILYIKRSWFILTYSTYLLQSRCLLGDTNPVMFVPIT